MILIKPRNKEGLQCQRGPRAPRRAARQTQRDRLRGGDKPAATAGDVAARPASGDAGNARDLSSRAPVTRTKPPARRQQDTRPSRVYTDIRQDGPEVTKRTLVSFRNWPVPSVRSACRGVESRGRHRDGRPVGGRAGRRRGPSH